MLIDAIEVLHDVHVIGSERDIQVLAEPNIDTVLFVDTKTLCAFDEFLIMQHRSDLTQSYKMTVFMSRTFVP